MRVSASRWLFVPGIPFSTGPPRGEFSGKKETTPTSHGCRAPSFRDLAAELCGSHPRRLAAHPRFHVYFTPTSASWTNLVQLFGRVKPIATSACTGLFTVLTHPTQHCRWLNTSRCACFQAHVVPRSARSAGAGRAEGLEATENCNWCGQLAARVGIVAERKLAGAAITRGQAAQRVFYEGIRRQGRGISLRVQEPIRWAGFKSLHHRQIKDVIRPHILCSYDSLNSPGFRKKRDEVREFVLTSTREFDVG